MPQPRTTPSRYSHFGAEAAAGTQVVEAIGAGSDSPLQRRLDRTRQRSWRFQDHALGREHAASDSFPRQPWYQLKMQVGQRPRAHGDLIHLLAARDLRQGSRQAHHQRHQVTSKRLREIRNVSEMGLGNHDGVAQATRKPFQNRERSFVFEDQATVLICRRGAGLDLAARRAHTGIPETRPRLVPVGTCRTICRGRRPQALGEWSTRHVP